MRNPNYEQVLTHLKAGFTVITPNNRLAKTLLEDYLHASTQNILEKPHCLSYDAFIEQLYYQLTHHSPNNAHPVLLTTQQTQYLWMKQLSSESGTVHQGLVNKAYEAWSRCQLWQINVNQAAFNPTEQTQLLRKWSNAFLQKLQELNVITTELIIPYIIEQVNPFPLKQVIWFCFDEYTPQQTALQTYFDAHGVLNKTLDLANVPCEQMVYDANNGQHELLTLINWLKQQLSENQPRIGVVVPDLNQQASAMNRLLQQHFTKGVFNISLGKTLSDYALISHALTWIGLNKQTITQEEATLVLSSKEEMLSRAQFLQENTLLQERLIDTSLFIEELFRYAPKLATALNTITHYPQSASPHAWVALFQERLTYLGFPGEYALNSGTYQCYQRFLLVFDEFKQLNLLVSTVSLNDAMKLLTELTQTTIFQPEQITTAPIQVLGLLEAAGCPFDALWVCGLTDECLPKKTKLTPFIPIALQKEQGLPYTSPEKEFELAHKTLLRFKQASQKIIFSYPKYTDDKSNMPSPLLTEFTLQAFKPPQPELAVKTNYHAIQYTETYELPLEPSLSHRGGTSLLANQAKCPFRAFAAHRLHLKKNLEATEGPNARERGMIIHQIMEEFWQHVKTQKTLLTLEEETLTKLIENAISKALAPYQARRKYSFPPTVQWVERKRLKQLVEALLSWEKQRPDFSVAKIEENYTVSLANIHFDVRIDRLDVVENNQEWVIDYKTSLPQKSPWQEEKPTEPQLLLYAMLNDKINTLLFLELKNGQIACKGLSEEDQGIRGIKTIQANESWTKLRSEWRKQLEALAQEFQAGMCIPKPIHPSVCEQCDFKDLCRVPFKN